MLKKYNLIIIFFFSILTILLDVGYALYLPIVFYYVLKDYKNIYYIIPSSFVSLFIFTGTNYLISFGILMILILFLMWIMTKITKGYYMYIFIGLLNIISYLIVYHDFVSPWKFIIIMILSIFLYIYFEKNIIDALNLPSAFYNQTFSEIILIVIASLGALNVTIWTINLGFVVTVYFSLYAASRWKNIYALGYALLIVIIEVMFFEIEEALFFPLIVAVYFLPFIYPVIIINVFSLIVILLNTSYQDETMLIIMGISLLFEILKRFIVQEHIEEKKLRENIYTQIAGNVSSEVLSFSEVLDKFVEGIKTPNEYNAKISEALKTIVQKHCNNCPKKRCCFGKNKGEIYYFFKSLLLQKDLYNTPLRNFLNECYNSKELYETARNLNYRIDFKEKGPNNNALIAQITGVATAMRQYAIEMVSKEELSYNKLLILKQKITSFGYDVSYFEIKRSFINDYLIVVGLETLKQEESITDLEYLTEEVLGVKSSIIFEKNEEKTTYFHIMPKLKLDILYGYGSLFSDGENICGDNYLIKNLKNGKFVSAISDGMGKGYSAFHESNMTLSLVKDIVELNLNSTTALEILNTFYAIQDYLERYATLDLLEINRYTKEAKFYKMGGTTTYIIKSSGKIEKIVNQNLPFGIDENIEEFDYELDDEDVILMSSDGIFENIMEEASLERFLFQIKNEAPQKIVYEIINYANKQKLKTKDDMTLIALKVKMI